MNLIKKLTACMLTLFLFSGCAFANVYRSNEKESSVFQGYTFGDLQEISFPSALMDLDKNSIDMLYGEWICTVYGDSAPMRFYFGEDGSYIWYRWEGDTAEGSDRYVGNYSLYNGEDALAQMDVTAEEWSTYVASTDVPETGLEYIFVIDLQHDSQLMDGETADLSSMDPIRLVMLMSADGTMMSGTNLYTSTAYDMKKDD